MLLAAIVLVAQSITKSTSQTGPIKQNDRPSPANKSPKRRSRLQRTRNRLSEQRSRLPRTPKKIAHATQRISTSLETIRKDLIEATKHDGIIDTPSIPSDFYHNARQYEQRGDYPNARRSYVGFFKISARGRRSTPPLPAIDRDSGRSGGSPSGNTSECSNPAESLVIPLMTILLEPDETRAEHLSDFIDLHPNFAPAVWELSREYSKRHSRRSRSGRHCPGEGTARNVHATQPVRPRVAILSRIKRLRLK